jgi:hypothetical protein
MTMTHSFTLGSARRTVQALALAGLTCLVAPAQSADLTSVSITAGIAQTPSTANKGEAFYQANFSFFYTGGQVILSGNPDGTGDTYVDDVLTLRITHPDGTVSTLSNNYYSGKCTGATTQPPMDIASKFQPGLNKVVAVLRDKCGGNVQAFSLWLNNF